MLREFAAVTLALACVAGVARAQEADVDHYREGQRLFAERKIEEALNHFVKADALVPNEPLIHSWIGACLNELGRYAEAQQALERAFALLQEGQRLIAEAGGKVPPIDVGYYTLLSGIQMNRKDFLGAVATINAYKFDDDGSETATRIKQALDQARQLLKAKLVAAAVDCLRAGDIACGRKSLEQADVLHGGAAPVLESLARETLALAERAPAETDQEAAARLEAFDKAIEIARFWVELAGPAVMPAQRHLAKTLAATKRREGYEEAVRILTALRDAPGAEQAHEGSLHLDLALAYAGLEQWDRLVESATAYVNHDPDDPLGQGYCIRSYGQFKLNKFQETVEDGKRCKNPDGTPRALAYVDTCEQYLAKQQANKAAAREEDLKRRCTHLAERVRWACSPLGEVPIEDLVDVLADFQDGQAGCMQYLDPTSVSALCEVGARIASNPLNLSTQTRDELEVLRGHIKKLLSVCKPALTASQAGGVEGGLAKVESALERPH